MSSGLREILVSTALEWQQRYGVAPSVTSALSEYDAARLVGMTDDAYGHYMQDKTAVSRGHDFIHQGKRFQIKAHRPSGKKGSPITNAGKVRNYDWDLLIWIRYDLIYVMQEAWQWDRQRYFDEFNLRSGVTPADMRRGTRLA